jgi:hypothetical protein
MLKAPNGRFAATITIEFLDGEGGGGAIFDGPYVEGWHHRATGRDWIFGLVPKDCISVMIGSVAEPVIDQSHLS